MDPYDRFNNQLSEDEYRRRQAAKAKRRKKRRMQRIALLAAFAVAALLLVLGIVAIFRAIFGGDKNSKSQSVSSSSAPASISVAQPTSGPGISWPVAPDPSLWSLILVNGQRPLPEGYDYETAVITNVGHKVDVRIADQLKNMVAACNAVEGNSLSVISGARSAATQNEKYQYLVEYFKGQGQDDAAAQAMAWQIDPPAGYSEHETGLAVDFVTGTVNEPAQAFAETPEFAWLVEHAHEYGFILRYPSEKEHITGILVQPYHFRYVGVEEATAIKEAGICLEEYLAALPEADSAPDSQPAGSTPPASDPGADAA